MKALDHSPPRLSDLKPEDREPILLQRHEANKAAWLAIHEEAGLTLGAKLARLFRATMGGIGA